MLESFEECVSVLDESIHRRASNSSHSKLEVSRLARWWSSVSPRGSRIWASPCALDFHPWQRWGFKRRGYLFSLMCQWNTHKHCVDEYITQWKMYKQVSIFINIIENVLETALEYTCPEHVEFLLNICEYSFLCTWNIWKINHTCITQLR
jgi:hypothetical protein